MATLAAQSPSFTGVTPTYSAASGGGDQINADNATFLIVRNGNAAICTVTIVTPASVRGLAVEDVVVAVPALTGEKWIGPFDRASFGNAQGRAAITYSVTSSVTVAAVAQS